MFEGLTKNGVLWQARSAEGYAEESCCIQVRNGHQSHVFVCFIVHVLVGKVGCRGKYVF